MTAIPLTQLRALPEMQSFGNILALEGSRQLIDAWNALHDRLSALAQGEGEAVAWIGDVGRRNLAVRGNASVYRKPLKGSGDNEQPLYTHPAAPTEVSEAMVERAAMAVAGSKEEWDEYSQEVRDGLMEIQRAALTAALKGSEHVHV